MIYQFLRWYARYGIKFFYKNVFIFRETKIDNNTPAIFSSNHPAGFYEAIILTTIFKKPIYFLVRSDYVNIPIFKWFFSIIRLLPIYRQSEGLNNVKKNNEVFSEINNSLKKNAFIGIYPEGTSKYQFKLNPLKKGIARIATGALNAGIKLLKIIPVSFNFSQPDKFRSFLCIYLGEELNLNPAMLQDKKDNVFIKELSSNINERMNQVNINISDIDKQNIFSKLQIILINNELNHKKINAYEENSVLPKQIKAYSQLIEEMNDSQFSKLQKDVLSYFNILNKEKTNDLSVIQNNINIFNAISLVLGFPLFIIGIMLNILPILPAIFIVKKYTKVYEYKAVLKVLISQFIYAIYFIIILIFGIIYFKFAGLVFILLPVMAWYSLKYYDMMTDYINSYRYNKSDKKDQMLQTRNQIIELIS
jgi:1-acyl-sn-glycerol-3-phosphate acyltransferase